MPSRAEEADPLATLEAWRARGEHRLDPVRFRFIEALARRAAGCGGQAQRILRDKLAAQIAAYGRALERAGRDAAPDPPPPPRRPLAELREEMARRSASHGDAQEAIEYLRRTWSRLSVSRRLSQSLAQVPANAGPLNSHQLVHRSLRLMRELSPEYLQHFMSHVDALLWLDQLSGAGSQRPPGVQAVPGQRRDPQRSVRRKGQPEARADEKARPHKGR